MTKVAKPPMIVMPAHPTNTWDRYGTKFEYIVMHYVGAVSTAKNNGQYYGNTPKIGASAHFFVDETCIVSSVPLDRAAGHCGVDYSNGRAPFWYTPGEYSTNKRSIGIEMCCKRTASGQWYIEPETVTRTVALVKWLMQEFNIPAANVIRHYDVCWKICPEPWVRDESQWRAFKKRISESEEEIDMNEKELIDLIDKRITAKLVGENTKPAQWIVDSKELEEAVAAGITDGTRPGGYAKREEVAAMVLREHKSVMSKAADAAAEAVKVVLEKIKEVL